jgi:hypothetical protein
VVVVCLAHPGGPSVFQLFKSDKPAIGLVYFEQVAPSPAKML